MIHQLDNQTIQRIAAGEVVERPLSVVKELVENSLDAGATSIQISIDQGGKKRILVADDGSGIDEEEIERAFLPHSTSKIARFEDLYELESLGFRGEALASIIQVADVLAQSKTKEARMGTALRYRDGKLQERSRVAMTGGTRIEVNNLFQHVPVRLKFMSSDVQEANRIIRYVYTMAIGHPETAFRLQRDDHLVLQTGANQSLEETLLVLYGTSYRDAMRKLDAENGTYRVHGIIGDNTFYRANRQMQFLFVNGRAIEDSDVRERIEKCYRSVIPNGRFPAFQLMIETNPGHLDVNIHPNKMKVQFAEKDLLLELVESSIRQALLHPNLPQGTTVQKPNREEALQRILQQYAWKPLEQPKPTIDVELPSLEEDGEELSFEDATGETLEEETTSYPVERDETAVVAERAMTTTVTTKEPEEQSALPPLSHLRLVGVLFRVYVLFEIVGEGSMLLMDQHAAHERVNFERFMKQARTKMITQQMLTPEVVHLTPEQSSRFDEREEILKQVGFSLSRFGEAEVALRAVPTLFKNTNHRDLFYDLLDMDLSPGHLDYDRLVEQIATKACRASVKQGDALSERELLHLYQSLSETAYPLTCPHGRPTVIRRHKMDFEKLFERVK